MMHRHIFTCMLAGIGFLATGISTAAVTVNGGGSHATINEALLAATAGAVLEITDSATYAESVNITVANITLRAAAGQTPVIQGVAAAHPVAPELMPVKWHGGAPDTVFNMNGATIVNSSTGLLLQGLTVDAGTADGALDLRFGTATVDNCIINAPGKAAAILSRGDQTLDSVQVNGSTESCLTTHGTGTLTIADSTFTAGGRAALFLGGTINVTDSTFIDNAVNTFGVQVGNTYGACFANFDRVVFRSAATATTGRYRIQLTIDGSGTTVGNFPGATWGDGAVNLVANRCDFISPRAPGAGGDFLDTYAINPNTGRIGWVCSNLTVRNSNFYGQYTTPINIGGSINEPNPPFGITPDEIVVENNVFFKTVNNMEDQCDVLGNYGWCAADSDTNIQIIGPWDPLYVNADAGDFRVATNGPAATAANGGGPTGALGVGGPAVATYTERTVAQSGTADFTTIQAAYDASSPGDVITILDSATYNENLVFETKKDIHLRSAPGLLTRPKVSGTSAQEFTLKIATTASRRVSVQGIDFESANLPVGSDVLVLTDGGQSVFKDCDFYSTGSTDQCVLLNSAANRLFENCRFNHHTAGYGFFVNGTTGITKFTNCTIHSTSDLAALVVSVNSTIEMDNVDIISRGPAFEQRHGTVDVRYSHLKSNGASIYTFAGNNTATFRNFFNVLECAGPLGAVTAQNGISRVSGTGAAQSVSFNSDIYGGPNGDVGILMRNDTDRATVRNTIISKFGTAALQELAPTSTATLVFSGYAATVPSPSHNVLVDSPNPFDAAGPNTVVATSPVALYINAPADFRLAANSIALDVNSGKTVTYAGSLGPDTTSGVSTWELY